jgi:hypothetical protein
MPTFYPCWLIAPSDCARLSITGGPDEKGVAGIGRNQCINARNPRCARVQRGIENLDALVFRIDPNEDQRSPVFHDQYGGKNHRRNVENGALDGLGL